VTDAATTDDGWPQLLAAFDADREAAGRAYEAMRLRLIEMFRWKGLANAEELADRAFERAARRLAAGEAVERGVAAYLIGIARKLVLEGARADARNAPLPEDLAAAGIDRGDARADTCLESCLADQPPGARDLLLRYLAGSGSAKIDARKELAAELGVNANTLRIRVHRIRTAVEACLRQCLADTGRNVSAPSATTTERSR
jgi:DNA-directed RNA polymerase specialized sigma24 family protein